MIAFAAARPEAFALVVDVIALAIVYGVVLRRTPSDALPRLAVADLAAAIATLAIVGSLFWGSDVRFRLLGFAMPWWAFTIVAYALLEVPLFVGWRRRRGGG